MIPLILATAHVTKIGSALAGRSHSFQPRLLIAGGISAVGLGLIFQFDLKTTLGEIIGYQILLGIGIGIGVQVPNLVATVTSTAEDVAITVSSVAFFMMLVGGWGDAVTDTALSNILLQRVPKYAPRLDGHEVLLVGAAGLKGVYSGETLQSLRRAYLDGLHGG